MHREISRRHLRQCLSHGFFLENCLNRSVVVVVLEWLLLGDEDLIGHLIGADIDDWERHGRPMRQNDVLLLKLN